MATSNDTRYKPIFSRITNDPRWFCSHCGFRNDLIQKRCPSCFKLRVQINKNKPIIVLDIDETLIASTDRNEKEIIKSHMDSFVDQHAKSLGHQYQDTMTDRLLNFNVGINQSCAPLDSPSINMGMRKLSLKSTHSAMSALSDITNITNLSNTTVTTPTVDSRDSRDSANDENNFQNTHCSMELKLDQMDEPTDDLFTLESAREPNPNRNLSPIKGRKRMSITLTRPDGITRTESFESDREHSTDHHHHHHQFRLSTPSTPTTPTRKPRHRSRATMDITDFIPKHDAMTFEPYKNVKKDMVYKSLNTKGKYYYIYFRDGAKQFVQRLIGWKLSGHIQLCIMTAANRLYMKAVMSELLDCAQFESYFDCIVTKEDLPFIAVQQLQSNSNSDQVESENVNQTKYRRVKSLNLIYEQLQCPRSVRCIMIDDNLRNFDLFDKLKYVYNIVEYRNPVTAMENYRDCKLAAVQRYIESVVINEVENDQLIESELNNGYNQYLLMQSEGELRNKIEGLLRDNKTGNVREKMLYHILIKKTESLSEKIKIVHEFSQKEVRLSRDNVSPRKLAIGHKEDCPSSPRKVRSRRNTTKYLDRLLGAINIGSFEYLDRYLMSGLIRIKKHDVNAFGTHCELLATVVLFYRLYFVISNNESMTKYFSSNFNTFLFNLYCCNVLVRYHLCNYDGAHFLRECMSVFATLTVVSREKRGGERKQFDAAETAEIASVQKRFGKKIFHHYLQNVMYYVEPPYIFDTMFDKQEITRLLPSKYRTNGKYNAFIQEQSEFFRVFQHYTSTLSTFIGKAFNSKIVREFD